MRFKALYLWITLFINGYSFTQNTLSDYVDFDNDITILVGQNTPITSSFNELPIVEPAISAHPTDNNILFAAAMVVTDKYNPYESCRLSSFYSNNGGTSWKETIHDYWGYDPWTAILSNGTACLSWLGTQGRFKGEFPLNIFSSSDCGKSWSKDVQTFKGFGYGHDGTKMVASKTNFYLTTVRFNNDMSAHVVLYESKYNEAFKEVGSIKEKGMRLNFCEPAVLSNNNVIIPFMHHQGKIWAQVFNPTTQKFSKKYIISENSKLGRGYSRLAIDSGPASKYLDRIYFVRAIADGGSSKGVWLNFSKDEGKTWVKEKRIDLFDNDQPSKANVPSIAVNKSGLVGISWVDGQHSKDPKSYDVYFSISRDGGKSFSKPARVTDVSSNPRTEKNGDVANKFQGGGHYLGIAAKADGKFQLIWSDSRNGYFQLQTCNIDVTY